MDRVITETASRGKAEADKAKFEGELDDLSASLFNEANRMVAVERKAKLLAEMKAQSLEERMKDTELLMGGQSGQMKDLGIKLETVEFERDQLRHLIASMESDPTVISSRSQQTITSFPNMESGPPSPTLPSQPAFSLSHPMPTLMSDILPFHEFTLYIRHLSRLKTQLDHPPSVSHPPGYSKAEHLANLLNLTSHSAQPFIKRCVEEDTDPCLRLDLAPGLNWLSRRNVQAAILEGQLIIEPTHHAPSTSCALCGTETSSLLTPQHPGLTRLPSNQGTMRKLIGSNWGFRSSSPSASTSTNKPLQQQQTVYVFRIDNTANNTTGTSTSFVLCSNYCLERLRATCEFWGAVRNVARAVIVDGKQLSSASPKTSSSTFNSTSSTSATSNQSRNVPPPPPQQSRTPLEAQRDALRPVEKRVVPSTPTAPSTPVLNQKRAVPAIPVAAAPKNDVKLAEKQIEKVEKVDETADVKEEKLDVFDVKEGGKEAAETPLAKDEQSAETTPENQDNGNPSDALDAEVKAESPVVDKAEASKEEIKEETSSDSVDVPAGESKAKETPEDKSIGAATAVAEERRASSDETTLEKPVSESGSDEVAKAASLKEAKPAIAPPPLPKRSGARPRGTPSLPSSPAFTSSPFQGTTSQPTTPAATPAAVPMSSALSRQGSYMNLQQPTDSRPWEIKTWDELVRLKEKLFWARVGMQAVNKMTS